MAHSESLSDLEKSVIIDALRDWFQFFQLMAEVKETTGTQGRKLEEETLDLIESLLLKGLMEVGTVDPERGFVGWALSPGEIRTRIQVALDDLSRPPSLGDVCWLANTAKGEQLARELLE